MIRTDKKDEQDFIIGCKVGDRKCQAGLFEVFHPYVRSLAKRYLHDENYLDDVLHDIFLKIFVKIKDTYDASRGPLKPWIARLAINGIYDFNKKNNRRLTTHKTHLTEDAVAIKQFPLAIYKMEKEFLFHFVKQMPAQLYEVFNMYVIDELSHEEIADILHCSQAASRKRLSRARQWLKSRLIVEIEKSSHTKI